MLTVHLTPLYDQIEISQFHSEGVFTFVRICEGANCTGLVLYYCLGSLTRQFL